MQITAATLVAVDPRCMQALLDGARLVLVGDQNAANNRLPSQMLELLGSGQKLENKISRLPVQELQDMFNSSRTY